ncbi:hypothetical protein JCM3766R1_005186 [Sporobolomyces carnicolor]
MSLFTPSYASMEQLELSRIADSPSPRRAPLAFAQQQQTIHSTSVLRSTRNIPAELRAPPYDPYRPSPETDVVAEDPLDERGPSNREEEHDRVEDPSNTSRAEQSASLPSAAATMLRERETGLRAKRHSYAGTTSISPRPTATNLLSASTSSLPVQSTRIPAREQRDPSNHTSSTNTAHRRASAVASTSSSAESSGPAMRDDSVFALPFARQLQSLKERNLVLAEASSTTNAKLAEANERIQHLEASLAAVESNRAVDAEGWEAEATRLSQELGLVQRQQLDRPNVEQLESRASAAERALAVEQSKKRRAKELINKLKCELINRRWKEKYEVELLEQEERNWEIKVVESEFELAILRGELACESAEREELQSIVSAQKVRIASAAAATQALLVSLNVAEETISDLQTSLTQAQATLAEREETVQELTAETESMREELGEARKKGGEGEAKIRAKSDKLEAEVKDLKAQLKATQGNLKSAEKATSSVSTSLETTQDALATLQAKYDALLASTPTNSRARPVDKGKKRPEPIPEPESEDDAGVEEESQEEDAVEPSPKPIKVKESKQKEKKAAPRKKVAEEPVKAKSMQAKSKPAKQVEQPVADVEADAVDEAEEEEDEDDPTPRPTPVSPAPVAAKKRKANVLSDKTTNASKDRASTLKVKKDKANAGAGGKKKLALDLSEDEQPPEAAKAKAKDEPAKKKKRKLFGDASKKGFDWQTQIENADVNGLIPGNLSPIKLDRTKKGGFLSFGLGGAAAKKSIF